MDSIFDDILRPSGALPLASLFSQNSNFRVVQAPQQAAKLARGVKQQNLSDSAPAYPQTSDKKSKGTKKRKHSTLEGEQAAAPTSKPTQKPAVSKMPSKADSPSKAQKPQASAQLHLPTAKAARKKDPKLKTKADIDIKASEPPATAAADERPRKHKKIAETSGSNAVAKQDIAGTTSIGNSSQGTTQVASQEDDAQIAGDEALQVIQQSAFWHARPSLSPSHEATQQYVPCSCALLAYTNLFCTQALVEVALGYAAEALT